jgi:hypothetical protein
MISINRRFEVETSKRVLLWENKAAAEKAATTVATEEAAARLQEMFSARERFLENEINRLQEANSSASKELGASEQANIRLKMELDDANDEIDGLLEETNLSLTNELDTTEKDNIRLKMLLGETKNDIQVDGLEQANSSAANELDATEQENMRLKMLSGNADSTEAGSLRAPKDAQYPGDTRIGFWCPAQYQLLRLRRDAELQRSRCEEFQKPREELKRPQIFEVAIFPTPLSSPRSHGTPPPSLLLSSCSSAVEHGGPDPGFTKLVELKKKSSKRVVVRSEDSFKLNFEFLPVQKFLAHSYSTSPISLEDMVSARPNDIYIASRASDHKPYCHLIYLRSAYNECVIGEFMSADEDDFGCRPWQRKRIRLADSDLPSML